MVAFNDRMAVRFLQATLFWGLLGLLLGLYTSIERLHWPANTNLPFMSFGRLQTVQGMIMLYAWAANAFFAGFYYTFQRLCQTRVWSDRLAIVHFWGWQIMAVAGAVTLALGINQGRPLGEMEWPLDIAIGLLWLLFTLNVYMTLKYRRVRYLYISLWFFLATVLTFPLLHTINALSFPMRAGKSYPLFPGVLDALLQTWFEQNINITLLVIPFVGLMYYFVPKAAGRPVYSFRLAVMQFWALLLIAPWLGARSLLYTSLPEWLQSVGAVAGLILLAPCLGAVVNGFSTLGWDLKRLGTKPILSFFAIALVSLGLWALEGALTSLKSLHLIIQYTDWSSARQALLLYGWTGSFVMGLAYCLVPKLWNNRLHSRGLAIAHLWLHVLALVLIIGPLAIGGILQGLSWLARNEEGMLINSQFILSGKLHRTLQILQISGYATLLLGSLVAAFNFFQTTRIGVLQDESREPVPEDQREIGLWPLSLGIIGALLLGTLAETLPLALSSSWMNLNRNAKPFSPLALQGRDLYVREGCVQCHTQMVRWSLKEELRYGLASQASEYQFQGPTLWGQRRLGPDLHRIGNRYPDLWHFQHLVNPRSTQTLSYMPAYPWLQSGKLKDPRWPAELWMAEAQKIQESLSQGGVHIDADVEVIAMIAYLQRLGADKEP